MIQDLEEVNTDAFLLFKTFTDDAKKLDRLYIPTRYPNGLPDITPDMAYSEDVGQAVLEGLKDVRDGRVDNRPWRQVLDEI